MTDQTTHRKKKNNAGLSGLDEPVFLVVGKLRKPHGLGGEWYMEVITDFLERLKKGKVVYLGNEKLPITIKTIRGHVNRLLVTFNEDLSSFEELGLRNQLIYVKTSELAALPAGFYYQHQIIGMEVQDEKHNSIGRIDEIIETGANDVYVIHSGKKEILFPAIKSVVINVDPIKKVMVVKLPEWI
jgi:16S rRNA processing protein RimM